jgi:hypothetical protein
MVADPILNNAYISGKIWRALGVVGVKEKQGIAYGAEPASTKRPVNDGVLLIGRIHVRYVLRIVNTADRRPHTYKLTFLY